MKGAEEVHLYKRSILILNGMNEDSMNEVEVPLTVVPIRNTYRREEK